MNGVMRCRNICQLGMRGKPRKKISTNGGMVSMTVQTQYVNSMQ